MPGCLQNDSQVTELNPDLLSSPYQNRTNWCVITGASCSGKTSLINQLAGEGFRTAPEVARMYIEEELANGRTIEEIRGDRTAFTQQMYRLMNQREQALPASDLIFLDRAIPDSLTYYRCDGLDPNEILPGCFRNQYAAVFMLNRLPYRKDGVRIADDNTAAYRESWLSQDYPTLGYNVVWVPVMPPEERLNFVLDHLRARDIL